MSKQGAAGGQLVPSSRRFPVLAAVLIGLLLLCAALIVRNEMGVRPGYITLREALGNHRLAVDAVWLDIGHATTSEEFYSQFRVLAAADQAMAEELGHMPGDRVDIKELRASLMDSTNLEMAIAANAGSDLPGLLDDLVRDREAQLALEASAAKDFGIPFNR